MSIPKNQVTSVGTITQTEHEEAAKAKRVKLVDADGNDYTSLNPLPTSATIDVGSLTVSVDLDAFTKNPPDNSIAVGTEDGTKTGIKHAIKIGSDGKLEVKDTAVASSLASIDSKLQATQPVNVQNFPATQPVSAVSLPLPTGAATEAKQDTGNTSLGNIDTKLANPLPLPTGASTEAKQDVGNTSLGNIDTKLANPLPLPTGASTEAKQDTGNTSLGNIDTKLANPLPLPTGAATAAKQDTGNASIASVDSKLNTLGQKNKAGSVPVTIASDQDPIPVSGSFSTNLDAFTKLPADNVLIVGTEDGTKTGTKRGIISNLRQQVLATHDRTQLFTYADFGTKNQRVIQIDYSSPTFPGTTVRRTFSYSLVGNSYRRDNEVWVII